MANDAIAVDEERGPCIPTAEQRTNGYLHDVVVAPHNDAHLDAIGVAEPFTGHRGIVEIDDHVDALFLDTER